MVNKQYNIQSTQSKLLMIKSKNYSPPPSKHTHTQNKNNLISTSSTKPTVVATIPNFSNLTNLDSISEEATAATTVLGGGAVSTSPAGTTYTTNLTYHSDHMRIDEHDKHNKTITDNCEDIHLFNKDLTISDIGRFQYILQMDRETGTHPDTLYRVPSRSGDLSDPSSKSSSINNQHTSFWKAGSQSPITGITNGGNCSTVQSIHQRRCSNMYHSLKHCWHYARWPFILLLICSILGLVMYFLLVETKLSTELETKDKQILDAIKITRNNSKIDNDYITRVRVTVANTFNSNDSGKVIVNGHAANYSNFTDLPIPKVVDRNQEEFIEIIKSPELINVDNGLLTFFVKNPSFNVEAKRTSLSEHNTSDKTTFAIVTDITERTNTLNNNNAPSLRVALSDNKIKQHADKKIISTKDKLQIVGFTSGHQNNFGIPIEEDERILRLLNEQILAAEQNQTQRVVSTTDSNMYRTKVSPTLPRFSRFEMTTEGLKPNNTEDSICQSTSLSMCRGILHYDLTTTISAEKYSSEDLQHFKYLIDSQCSQRTTEFICSLLEPECRPQLMGALKPCKRFCKSVMESCSPVIANSAILTAAFDCDSYEDSTNRSICEDPTRRSKCYSNEFKCQDSTCIPFQWKCDNIKDCARGEDEESCKFCEREEFRCISNDKCIPDKWRCDQYNDCPDGSDELDCFEDDSSRSFPAAYGNARTFPYVHEQAPNSPNSRPYLTISGEDRVGGYAVEDQEANIDRILPTGAENLELYISRGDIKREPNKDIREVQIESASERILPKSLVNFQDSKEIMMTSDSEADYKYSSTSRAPLKTSHLSPCPEGELRCVSGRCISVNQLCDKVTDCPDGADEAMCVYKN